MTTPDPTLAARLAPCPFCGGNAGAYPDPNHSTGWDIGCFSVDCHVEPHVWQEDYDVAVKQWNTRAPNQLITTAEADARVEAAVLAAVEACAVFLETHEVGQDVLKGYVVSQRNELSGGTHPGEAYAAAVRSRGVTG